MPEWLRRILDSRRSWVWIGAVSFGLALGSFWKGDIALGLFSLSIAVGCALGYWKLR